MAIGEVDRDGSTITLSFHDCVTGKLFIPLIEIRKKEITHLQWKVNFYMCGLSGAGVSR